MKVFGLCSSVFYVAVKAKPQASENIQQFYSDYFQDNNQDQDAQKDHDAIVADHYDDYVDYGSGSGDGNFQRDVADEFIKRDLKKQQNFRLVTLTYGLFFTRFSLPP